jgi:hypothetical protein
VQRVIAAVESISKPAPAGWWFGAIVRRNRFRAGNSDVRSIRWNVIARGHTSCDDAWFVLIVNKQLLIIALTSCPLLWANPSTAQQQHQLTFTGRVSPQCSIVMINDRPNSTNNPRFVLLNNRGSITTLCNTGSTLTVNVDRTDRDSEDAKIRFAAGGTGIYASADRSSRYRETAKFSTNGVTSALGDTAQIEVDSAAPTKTLKSIVVYASLTPQ